jgi:hypothetical protein
MEVLLLTQEPLAPGQALVAAALALLAETAPVLLQAMEALAQHLQSPGHR